MNPPSLAPRLSSGPYPGPDVWRRTFDVPFGLACPRFPSERPQDRSCSHAVWTTDAQALFVFDIYMRSGARSGAWPRTV